MDPEQALQRLAHAGIVARERGEWVTTEKWDRAFMRAEEKLMEFDEAPDDLRVPVGYALADILGPKVPEADFKAMVAALLPLEMAAEEEMEPEDEPELEAEPEP